MFNIELYVTNIKQNIEVMFQNMHSEATCDGQIHYFNSENDGQYFTFNTVRMSSNSLHATSTHENGSVFFKLTSKDIECLDTINANVEEAVKLSGISRKYCKPDRMFDDHDGADQLFDFGLEEDAKIIDPTTGNDMLEKLKMSQIMFSGIPIVKIVGLRYDIAGTCIIFKLAEIILTEIHVPHLIRIRKYLTTTLSSDLSVALTQDLELMNLNTTVASSHDNVCCDTECY